MFDNSRRKTARLRYATARQARLANFPVGSVVLELQRKEFKCEDVELVILRLPHRIPPEREKAGGEI